MDVLKFNSDVVKPMSGSKSKIIDLDTILEMYKVATEEVINELTNIIIEDIKILDPQVHEIGRNLLMLSSDRLMDRWKSGAKYLRTRYASQAISNYPEDILRLSVSLDAIVNNLDDILDETLDQEAKSFYIVEIIKLLTIFNYQNADEGMKKSIARYFSKLISIALLEKFYYNKIKSKHDPKNPLEYAIPLYDCRSLDMDIFIQLPLMRLSASKEDSKNITNIARTFRAVNLLKKDINDFKHDIEQGQDTIITIFHKTGDLEGIVHGMVDYYSNKLAGLSNKDSSSDIVTNYKKMFDVEIVEVEKALKNLSV